MKKQPSTRVLTATVQRAFQFLHAEGTDAGIRAALLAAGFTPAERAVGWDLLHRLSNGPAAPVGDGPAAEAEVRGAVRTLDNDGVAFLRRAEAALRRLHPEGAEAVFGGLDALPSVSLRVAAALDRLGRADAGMLSTLDARGLDAGVRGRLSALLRTVEGGVALAPAQAPVIDAAQVTREADLAALRAWYADWSTTARACIALRGQLIRLGLAKRRSARDRRAEGESPSMQSRRAAA